DRHPGVGRLEVRDGVLPVLLALPRGRVVPEGHRDVAVTSSGAVVAAAGHEPEGRDHHRRRGRQCLASCHGSVLWSGGESIDRPARVRRSAGGNGDSTLGGGGVVIEITSGRHQPWPPPTMAALTPVCQSLSITFYYRWSVRDSGPARARLDADRGTMRVCRPAAAWQDRGGRPSTGDRRAEGVTVPGENLTRQEAAERAALVDVESYDVELDLTRGERVFASRTTISFSARTGASTFVDLIADTVHEIRLNGRYLDPHAWDGARITLTDLEERNELLVVADARYMRTGEGLHRFVDPVDEEVYLYSQFEVADSRRVFAVFEQPDLKASFRFTVTAPRHWTVVSNSPTPEPEPAPDHHDAAVWRFAPTPRIPSYITAVVAGPYHRVSGELTSSDGRTVPLGVYCRASLAEHLDAENIMDVTRAGFAFFEEAFDRPYPFEKYDQLFVPEFNASAMENAGAVTFLENYVFRSKVPE